MTVCERAQFEPLPGTPGTTTVAPRGKRCTRCLCCEAVIVFDGESLCAACDDGTHPPFAEQRPASAAGKRVRAKWNPHMDNRKEQAALNYVTAARGLTDAIIVVGILPGGRFFDDCDTRITLPDLHGCLVENANAICESVSRARARQAKDGVPGDRSSSLGCKERSTNAIQGK